MSSEQSKQSSGQNALDATVINVRNVMPFVPDDAVGTYESRLLVDDESAGSRNLVMNYFTLLPGRGTYAGSHPPPYDEVYYILRGRGVLTIGGAEGRRHAMTPDSLAFIPAGAIHQLENTGDEPLDMLTMMAHLPAPGVNGLYDERKAKWGTSFREIQPDKEHDAP